MELDNPLEMISKIAEHSKDIILRIFDAIGILYEPTRIRREANAKAESKLLHDMKLYGISEKQAQSLFRYEKIKQDNYLMIVDKAFNLLDWSAIKSSDVDSDWMRLHFEKSSITSNEELQVLWARILAGEIVKPGKYSKQTLSIVQNISTREANIFKELTSFLFYIDDDPYIVFQYKTTFKELPLSFAYDDLLQLQSLGLISVDSSVFGSGSNPHLEFDSADPIKCKYFSKEFTLIPKADDRKSFGLINGIVNLTGPGRELLDICDSVEDEQIFEYLLGVWKQHGHTIQRSNKKS